MSILEVSHLKKVYTTRFGGQKVEALSDVSFSVEEGDFVSIIGASGCGKSTIFRLINGLEQLQKGEILVNGRPIREQKQYSAFMPQKDLLFPWRTIEKISVCRWSWQVCLRRNRQSGAGRFWHRSDFWNI